MSYDATKAEAICEQIAQGKSLRAACSVVDMPAAPTFLDWVHERPELAERYRQARARQYELLADELMEIADESSRDTYVDDNGNTRTDTEVVARSRLRLDTRKWMLSKMLPKVYGDKIELGGSLDVNSKIERITRRIVDGTDT